MGPRLVAHDPSVRVGIFAAERPKASIRGHLPSEAGEESRRVSAYARATPVARFASVNYTMSATSGALPAMTRPIP
jgi:hypothetical protein